MRCGLGRWKLLVWISVLTGGQPVMSMAGQAHEWGAATASAVPLTPSVPSFTSSTFKLEDIGRIPQAQSDHSARSTSISFSERLEVEETKASSKVGAYGPSAVTTDAETHTLSSPKLQRERGWSKTLTRGEIAYQALSIVDLAQTLECMDRRYCEERNVLLGKRPSKGAVIGYIAGTSLLQYIIVREIARHNRDTAKMVLFGMLAGRGVIVGLNFRELRRSR